MANRKKATVEKKDEPAKDAPAESPTLAEERTRLNKEYSEIEGPLKQTKLLASRADQLADQITERRRAAYARQLFEQTPSVISPSLWLDSANALGRELSDLSRLLRAWFDQMRAPENWSHVAAAVATLLLLGLLMMLLRHWLKR